MYMALLIWNINDFFSEIVEILCRIDFFLFQNNCVTISVTGQKLFLPKSQAPLL